jgi:DNA-binding transcriptional ArsR family regulator
VSAALVRALHVLGEKRRLAIVEFLAKNPGTTAGEVGKAIGCSPSLTSHHLILLREAGLVTEQKRGLFSHNTLNVDELGAIIDSLRDIERYARARAALAMQAVPE